MESTATNDGKVLIFFLWLFRDFDSAVCNLCYSNWRTSRCNIFLLSFAAIRSLDLSLSPFIIFVPFTLTVLSRTQIFN